MAEPSERALLATDLDGTLAVNGRIGNADVLAARELKAAGIPLLVVTGRNPFSLKGVDELWDVASEGIFSSGAGILESRNSEPWEMARLTGKEVQSIVEILTESGQDFCVLHPIPENHYFTWKRFRPRSVNPDFDRRMEIYRQWVLPEEKFIGSSSGQEASQILVILPPGDLPEKGLLRRLSSWSVFYSASPIDHRSIWLEIFPAGVNKGSSLDAWCRKKKIPSSRVLALGNDLNDESMLSWAGRGCVVQGAPPEMKSRYPVLPPAGEGGFPAAVREALRLFSHPSQSDDEEPETT
jgi:hydroxymethylpyrimidine pyrophosphatase-like HAD family hydrolase